MLEKAKGIVERTPEPRQVAPDDELVDDPAGPTGVSGEDRSQRQVQDDRDGGDTGRRRATDEGLSCRTLDVRCVHDRQEAVSESSLEGSVKATERGTRRALIGFVAGDQRPVGVGREDLGGLEMAGGKGRLAGTGRSDQDDDARVRKDQLAHVGYGAARRTSYPPPSAARISYAGWS